MASIRVTCLCGKNTETFLLETHLPVPVYPCACNICRYTTGVLYSSCLPLPSRPGIVVDLTEYRSSPTLTRYFCPACGSHMFINATKDGSWSVCSGVIDQVAGHEQVSCLSLEKILQHEFVGDTKDGGLALCLADLDSHPVPLSWDVTAGAAVERAVDPSQRLPHPSDSIHSVAAEGLEAASHQTKLGAACHCGGVTFWVTRPSAASEACSSPYPDLLMPYHSSGSENPADEKWWLRVGKTKYLAGTCACRSCRLGSGSPIQTWAFIPRTNLVQSDGKQIEYDMGTLNEIESSKDCFRNFCRTCGATVFWHCRERPDLVDVSIGLLRAEEGSRAETWLQWWTGRVSFTEDALDQVLVGNLQRGLSRIHVPE